MFCYPCKIVVEGAMVQSQAFWRQDIANVLRAVQRANLPLSRVENPSAQAYCAGFEAALAAVGLAFDIVVEAPRVGVLERTGQSG